MQRDVESLNHTKRPGPGTDTKRHIGMLEHIVGILPTKQVAFTVVGIQPTYLLLRQIAFQAVVIAVPMELNAIKSMLVCMQVSYAATVNNFTTVVGSAAEPLASLPCCQ